MLIICFDVHGCWEQERSALLELKASLKGSSYDVNLDSWKDDRTSDCCDWQSVTCGGNGRVFSLRLQGVTYPYHPYRTTMGYDYIFEARLNVSVLLPFQELRELDLSHNSFSSWIETEGSPKLSSRLTKLESLDLSINQLNSSILPQISGFQSLKSLHLSGNEIGGTIQLIKLPNLELLDLSMNQLNSIILSNLSGLPSLKVLNLNGNQLTGHLQLHDIEAIKNLEKLDLSGNSISSIINHRGCGKMQRLQVVDLSSNSLTTLPSCWRNLTSLLKVHLSDNQFSGNIPSWMKNWTQLRQLDLSGNQFSGSIPSWIKNWTQLRQLDLSLNQFSGNIGLSALLNLLSLEALDLHDNRLQIPLSFNAFANHTKLRYFIGDNNQVIFDSETQVQSSNSGLQLKVLSLSSCRLSTLPPFLKHQYELRLIDLSHNSLQGNFPAWLLENNLQLDTLLLKNNSLHGELQFPSSVHAYIREIDASYNEIQGYIPTNISVFFPKMISLYMSNNDLNGTIPSKFCDLRSLSDLDLSNNHFSGGLGYLSKSCLNLTYINLSNNNLDGEVTSFHNLRSLSFLDLSRNNFSGPIRADMFRNSLLFLDLSHNKLNGTLPSYNELQGIMFVYLNNNRLSGQITDEFHNTSWLEILDLSNNDLSGHIPSGFGNLARLGALLLRGNRFSGPIPVQLCKLQNLTLLDLSHNNLSGPIPPCLCKLAPTSILPAALIDRSWHEFQDAIFHATFYLQKGSILEDIPADFMTKSMIYTYKGVILDDMFGINLSSNKLTGVIPPEIGNISQLLTLNLSYNNLWGAIPATFSNLKNIESLDISYNKLYGNIPEGIVALNTLEVFSVAHNNLSGRIPFEAQFSTFTVSSYEGNPFLCGSPLPKSCSASELPSSDTNVSEHEVDEDNDGWIDMPTFYVTFAVASVIMFLATVTSLFINPNWQKAWFHLVEACITSSYFPLEDTIRKLRRVRNVV